MRGWIMYSGLVSLVIGLVALGLGLYGVSPITLFEGIGAILLAAGAAAEGYFFGAKRTSRVIQATQPSQGQKP
jgi:uncharacterized membrane protein HdeD (DUF308 family)